MSTVYLGSAKVPDGYFGEKAIAHLCFDYDSQLTLAVYPFGYHRTQVPCALTADEALWLIANHPSCRSIEL